ncbi:MAG: ankyrin repeat domain-containing protein [Roseivirga sp.]
MLSKIAENTTMVKRLTLVMLLGLLIVFTQCSNDDGGEGSSPSPTSPTSSSPPVGPDDPPPAPPANTPKEVDAIPTSTPAGKKLKDLLKKMVEGTDSTSPQGQVDLLNRAISTGDEGVALAFIEKAKEKKLDLDTETAGGTTPLQMAAHKGSVNIIRALAKAGVDVNKAHANGKTPVDLALEAENLSAIEALANAGADVNRANKDGKPPLHLAAEKNAKGAIEALAKAGADVNKANDIGMTPLHVAAQNDSAEAVTALLEKGADAALKTNIRGIYPVTWGGETPYQLAKDKKSQKAIKAFEAQSVNS